MKSWIKLNVLKFHGFHLYLLKLEHFPFYLYRLLVLSKGMDASSLKKVVINTKSRHGTKSNSSGPGGNSTRGNNEIQTVSTTAQVTTSSQHASASNQHHSSRPFQHGKKPHDKRPKVKYGMPPISTPSNTRAVDDRLKQSIYGETRSFVPIMQDMNGRNALLVKQRKKKQKKFKNMEIDIAPVGHVLPMVDLMKGQNQSHQGGRAQKKQGNKEKEERILEEEMNGMERKRAREAERFLKKTLIGMKRKRFTGDDETDMFAKMLRQAECMDNVEKQGDGAVEGKSKKHLSVSVKDLAAQSYARPGAIQKHHKSKSFLDGEVSRMLTHHDTFLMTIW